MISIFEKVRLQQWTKAKYSILASILHIFQKNFLHSLIPTCTIHSKSHGFLISCFEYGKKNSENVAFWKNSFCHSFLNKIIYALVMARFRLQYGQYFPSFSYFADLFHKPLGERNKSKIWETRKRFAILCEINVR